MTVKHVVPVQTTSAGDPTTDDQPAGEDTLKVSGNLATPRIAFLFLLGNIAMVAGGSAVAAGSFLLPLLAGNGLLLLATLAVRHARTRPKAPPARKDEPAGPPRDELTGLPLVDEGVVTALLDRASEQGHRLAVIAFDIDRLKDVNSVYGSATGDELLRRIAGRLAQMRDTRTFRLAGDRFVMLYELSAETTNAELMAVAALDRLSRPLALETAEGEEVSPAASVGIAIFPEHGTRYEPLLRCAEMAIDDAKRAGGRRCRLYTHTMIARLRTRKTIERDLRLAVENGDLCLYYQPQIDLATQRPVAVEALLRWQHPERGMIPPVTFIPVAEDSGLIRTIGNWVISEACAQARRWHDMGLPIGMAINISPAQLRQQDLAVQVGGALLRNALPPETLEIELTESLFVDPSELMMRRTLQRLVALGARLSIDDFGTGYSSLAYLKRLPVGKIKIDKSFIAGVGTDETDDALVRVIIEIGRTFGKKVLAEGVETAEQQAFLAREGCDEVQGYFFARPLPVEDCTAYLSSAVRDDASFNCKANVG